MEDSPQLLEWSGTLLDGKRVSPAAAEAAVAALGPEWRLPTVQELFSIVDHNRHNPAIDTDKFPDTKSCAYWTSTPVSWDSAARWVVLFGYGHVSGYGDYDSACVRACRASQ